MGNTQDTFTRIDPFFEMEMIVEEHPIEIIIDLPIPAVSKENVVIKQIQILCDRKLTIASRPEIFKSKREIYDKKPKSYSWKPKTHMRSFEFIQSDTHPEIARGQGIGVIVLEPLETYIKLVYDKNSTNGVEPALFASWDHGYKCRWNIALDLSLGYDILYVTKDMVSNICTPWNKKDHEPTIINFESLKHLEKYQHDHLPPLLIEDEKKCPQEDKNDKKFKRKSSIKALIAKTILQ